MCFFFVGFVLRVRVRKFFVVVNCTVIDWFYEWSEDVLVSVSVRFLEETEGIRVSFWVFFVFFGVVFIGSGGLVVWEISDFGLFVVRVRVMVR